MEYIKLIFNCFTHVLLNVNFQKLYIPLLCAGIVGFVVLFVKRRCCGYV